ncbi:MAG: fibronectin type III domain-containing protein, partial [Odoribacter sp.]|nr:fibronectin type III domain-containing protein [Odoribacter sp.]
FQGDGYTPDELRDRLINSTHNLDAYNQKFNGLLGAGYIDVGLALTPPSTVAPDTSRLILVDAYDDWAIVEWEVKEAADGPMSSYVIRWSTSPLQAETPASVVESKTINVRYVKAGTILRDTIRGLSLGETYYFSINAYDRWGGVSEDVPQVSATVKENLPPVLFPDWNGTVLLNEGAERIIRLKVDEPENQRVICALTPALDWIKVENNGDSVLNIRLAPGYTVAGQYALQIQVSDQYGKSSASAMPIEVLYKEIAPRLIQTLPDLQLMNNGKRTTVKLTDYFADPKGRALIYEVENSSKTVANVQRSGDNLVIEPKLPGRTEVMVRAKNEAGLLASQRFVVEVIPGEDIVAENALTVYPNPVKNDLKVSLPPALRGEVSLK